MAILSTEILKYKAAVHNNTTSNGGRMSAVEIASNSKNNVFPDVSEADRTAGITQYRKVFHKLANADDDTLSSVLVHLLSLAAGDDYVTLIEGTNIDTQADVIAAAGREYGAGALNAEVTAGGSVLVVDAESATPVIFATGDTIAVIDGSTVLYYENVIVVKNSAQYTITLDTGDTVPSTLAADDTIVAACIVVSADLAPVGAADDSDLTITSTEGLIEENSDGPLPYPIAVGNIGTVYEEWTITFTSATAFTCAGDTVGAVAAGSILAEYAPLHPVFEVPYFTIPVDAWGGTWAEGDTLVFTTSPAAVAVWRKRVVPVGASLASFDGYTVRLTGQAV